MPNKTAFVTGGTGFIGFNLVEHLSRSGWDVIALHRPNSRLTQLKKHPVRLAQAEIEDPALLERVKPRCLGPDHCVLDVGEPLRLLSQLDN